MTRLDNLRPGDIITTNVDFPCRPAGDFTVVEGRTIASRAVYATDSDGTLHRIRLSDLRNIRHLINGR